MPPAALAALRTCGYADVCNTMEHVRTALRLQHSSAEVLQSGKIYKRQNATKPLPLYPQKSFCFFPTC